MTEIQTGRTSTLVGAVLGNYRITGALGTGAMGMVFRAKHELLGRAVAIKLLRKELTANAELVQRFFNEAKAASAIHHPGIIDVVDFGYTPEGRAYLVMEMLEGEALSARIQRRGRLAELEAAQIGRGIASALTAAHGKNIIHRDLKPDNVFLVPDPDLPQGERPKVLDFGKLVDLAPSDGAVTQTGALMGTPLYMAPEQARAAGMIDHRADLYSLGCMMYEMLVGEPPFVAPGAGEIIAMQLFSPVQQPSQRVDGISHQMNHLIMRLLEKEPAARCQSAGEVVDALGGITGHGFSAQFASPSASASAPRAILTRTAPEEGFGAPPVAPRKSSMPLIAAIVTVLIAGGAVAGFLIGTRGDGKPEAEPVADPVKVLAPDPPKVIAPDPVKVVAPDPVKVVAPDPAKVVAPDPVKVVTPDPPKHPPPVGKTKPWVHAQDVDPPVAGTVIVSPSQVDPNVNSPHPTVDPGKVDPAKIDPAHPSVDPHPGPHVDGLPTEDDVGHAKKPAIPDSP
jgi:Protein kinase domain